MKDNGDNMRRLYCFGIKYIENENYEQICYHSFCEDDSYAEEVLEMLRENLRKVENIKDNQIVENWFYPVTVKSKFIYE